MPARDRLASTLFETATLRSSTGLSALEDMISLCEADVEVEYRPGLEPHRCQCSESKRPRKLPKIDQPSISQQLTYDWRHVYNCVKKASSEFTELCFLYNEWVSGDVSWSEHCHWHLARPETLPVQCDPLTYGGVLATAGYCPLCMSGSSLEPEARLRQFLDRGPWKAHVQSHYETYVQSADGGEHLICPHPGKYCNASLYSVEHLKFHFLDVHCRDFAKESNVWEVSTLKDEVLLKQGGIIEPTPRTKRRRGIEEDAKDVKVKSVYQFIDETVKMTKLSLVSVRQLPHQVVMLSERLCPRVVENRIDNM
ncbi:hypothetical protein CDEST_05690 [Colletotrichum destructivum]|uniref:C2H2-type domain-containing protein n=1 Tax=Colletotrichum destructivum TaxID=34406 RepID=A0AAX4IBD6_9PEZI|nr:hypothetical protein CDEST_05690 [Colletotrichum destructivum]